MPQERDMIVNNSSGFPTYLLLSDKNDIASVNQSIVKTNYTNPAITYSVAPLFDNHFNLNFGDTSNTRYVFIFLSASLLILSLALINYVNLTTARASTRAKEVGIRKVVGAQRQTLAMQFFLESAITTAISFLFAIVLIQIFRPAFFSALQLNIDSSFLTSPTFIASVATLLIFCVFLSGSYPALVLPSFKPVEVLKGKVNVAGQRAGWLRKTLTIFQFAVSIGLIICTLVMSHQLNYLRTKETGLARQQVLAVPIDPQWANSHQAIKHEVGQESGVVGVAIGSIPLYRADMSGVSLVTSPITNEQVGTKWITVDKDFFDVLGVKWMQKPEAAQWTGNHIFNETAVQAFGLLDKQINIDLSMGDNNTGVIQGKLVGIVEDFNFQSLRNKIEPLIITVITDKAMPMPDNSTLYIRIDKDTRAGEKIASIKKIYEKYSGDTPFSYYFLDDAFNELQNGEQRLGRIFGAFTSVALMIASLGMLGLITFTVERRTKEISIRKVLGASVATILSLLSAELVILVLIGVLIGSPIACLVMRDWLNNFYYQTDIPSTVIFISSATVLILAGSIVCLYGIRAALENPTKNLMNE
jgi:putative ABC transport system permease protein